MAGGSRVKDCFWASFVPSVKGERRRKIAKVPCSTVRRPSIHLKSTPPPTDVKEEDKKEYHGPREEKVLAGCTAGSRAQAGLDLPSRGQSPHLGVGARVGGACGRQNVLHRPLLANDVPFAKKRSSRQVWNKINETNQGRRISLDPLSRTAMLSVHRGLLALRDTGTVRGERDDGRGRVRRG